MINDAIAIAYNASIKPVGYLADQAPFFYYDIALARIDLIAPIIWCNGQMKLFLNINLYEEFGTFFTFFSRAGTQTYNIPFDNYEIIIENYGINRANFVYIIHDPTAPLVSSIIMPSEFSNLYNLGVLRKILLTSGSIPAVAEFTSNTSIIPSINSMNSSDKILSDFIVPQDVPGSYRSMIQYVPSVYRLLDLKSNSKLVTIDLSFYWEDNLLNRRQMFLGPGATMSVKLMFRKKTYNGVKLYNEIKKKDEGKDKLELAKKGIIQVSSNLPKLEIKQISQENLDKIKNQNKVDNIINSKKKNGGNLLNKNRKNMYTIENELPINKNASSNKKIPYYLKGGTSFPTVNNNSSSNVEIPRF